MKFCGRGGQASDIFCTALSFSHLRCQLPPGGSLGLSVLFVRCVSVLFVGIECYSREEKQITPSKRTIAVRLLSGAFPINYKYGITSRNAPPLPYGRSVHSVGNREVCGCCLSRTIPPSAFGSHRLAAARSHSGSTLPSCRFATFTQGRHGWESVHSVGDRVVCTNHSLPPRGRWILRSKRRKERAE